MGVAASGVVVRRRRGNRAFAGPAESRGRSADECSGSRGRELEMAVHDGNVVGCGLFLATRPDEKHKSNGHPLNALRTKLAEPRHDPNPVVFLVDVDNTLLDNDRIQNDLKRHLEREFGAACRDRYWAILEQLFTELGYRDYLGALQRYRGEHPQDIHLLTMSSFLIDYPFANRLYPGSLDVIERFRAWGPTVILSDGDVVFQPRKVERSGIFEAVDGHGLLGGLALAPSSFRRQPSIEHDPRRPAHA